MNNQPARQMNTFSMYALYVLADPARLQRFIPPFGEVLDRGENNKEWLINRYSDTQ